MNKHDIPLGTIPTIRDPRSAFLTVDGITLTAGEFDARANRRARALASHGVGEGDMITIALPNSAEFYETTFAAWKLGAVPNIVSSKLAWGEYAQIVSLVQPKVVIGGPHVDGAFRRIEPGAPVREDLSPEPLDPRISPYWKAMTSGGSTGRPKVIVDHMSGVWEPNRTMLLQELGGTTLNAGPLYHNGPFSFAHFQLFSGGHTIELGRFDPRAVLAAIQRYQVDHIGMVPTMMSRIAKLPAEERAAFDVSSLRVLLHFGAMCPVWLKRTFIDWLGPERIWELYAGTERQGLTLIRGDEWLERPGSVGRVAPGYRLRILRDDGADAAPGETGEIFFLPDGGKNATYHYLGAEAKMDGEYETLGDLGHLDRDGFLFLADRRTDLIISGGANIYPAEVEAALEEHPLVVAAIAIGLPDEDLGQRVHAIVEVAHEINATLLRDELFEQLKTSLTRYKWPRSIEFVTESLRDDAGKVRRSALREARIGKL